MSCTQFISFLNKKNSEFLDAYSTESAFGLVHTLRGGTTKEGHGKKCVMISFDPPLGSPLIVFNWGEKDVWYMKDPVMEYEFFSEMDRMLELSENNIVIFLEKSGVPHMRKIHRFIRNYKEKMYKNRPLELMPRFLMAEYKNPLRPVEIEEIAGGLNDTYSS